MPRNTLFNHFFKRGAEFDPEDRFDLNRKSRSRRLREIYGILGKHHFLRGFSPEEFRALLEDLGPSFVKIGQTLSTRSEILPQAYCDELAKLQTECDPLPFDKVLEALKAIYGDRLERTFDEIDPHPLGSASLAQVHKAWLKNGDIVAVKVQRPGVKATMAQDIDIMRVMAKRAARFAKGEQMVDFSDVSQRDRLRVRGGEPRVVQAIERGRGIRRLPACLSRTLQRVLPGHGIHRGHSHRRPRAVARGGV